MKIRQSDNKKLFYVINSDEKIVYSSMIKEKSMRACKELSWMESTNVVKHKDIK